MKYAKVLVPNPRYFPCPLTLVFGSTTVQPMPLVLWKLALALNWPSTRNETLTLSKVSAPVDYHEETADMSYSNSFIDQNTCRIRSWRQMFAARVW